MTTIGISNDLIQKICEIKIEDSTLEVQLMKKIVNLIVFEDNVTDEQKDIAKKAGIKIITFNEVIAKGK